MFLTACAVSRDCGDFAAFPEFSTFCKQRLCTKHALMWRRRHVPCRFSLMKTRLSLTNMPAPITVFFYACITTGYNDSDSRLYINLNFINLNFTC